MPLRYPLRESDFDDINNGTASPFIFRHDSDNNQTQISSSPIQEAHMVQKHSYGYPDLLSGALLQEDSTAHAGDRARSSSSSHSLASSYVELDQSQQIARTSALHQAYSTSHTSAGPVPTRQLYSKVEDMSAPTDSDGRHLAYNDVHDVDSSGAIPQAVRAWPARVSHSIHPFPQRPSTSNGTLESGVVSPQYIPFRDRSPPDYSSLTPVPLRPHGKSVPRLTPEFLPQTVLSIKSGWSSGWYGHNSADRITFECSGLNEIGVCLGDLLSGLPRDKVFQWDREFSFQYYADRQQPPQIEISIAWPGYGDSLVTHSVNMHARTGSGTRSYLLEQAVTALVICMRTIRARNIWVQPGFEKYAIAMPNNDMKGVKEEDCILTALVYRGGIVWQPEIYVKGQTL